MLQQVEPFVPLRKRLLGLLVSVLLVLAYVALTSVMLWATSVYGIAVFFGTPIVWSLALCAWHVWRFGPLDWSALGEILVLQVGMLLVVGFVFLLTRVEGLICLAMAAPLVLAATVAVWAVIAGTYALFRVRRVPPSASGLGIIALLRFSGMEAHYTTPPPPFEVVSEVLINAAPEVVWNNVVTFPELPPPTNFIFRAGIAYPIRARIEGQGPGAIRRCEFNTGAFVEPIEVWDEPRLLQFSVTENPPPMHELNPFGETNPPHLHGFLEAVRGQFELLPQPGGKTLLRGTTWYRHNLYPAAYWRLWSDRLIHAIHLRVLDHIKRTSESVPSS